MEMNGSVCMCDRCMCTRLNCLQLQGTCFRVSCLLSTTVTGFFAFSGENVVQTKLDQRIFWQFYFFFTRLLLLQIFCFSIIKLLGIAINLFSFKIIITKDPKIIRIKFIILLATIHATHTVNNFCMYPSIASTCLLPRTMIAPCRCIFSSLDFAWPSLRSFFRFFHSISIALQTLPLLLKRLWCLYSAVAKKGFHPSEKRVASETYFGSWTVLVKGTRSQSPFRRV